MAEIYPVEDVLQKLAKFTPLRRILLATAGTNQSTLSAYHGNPVMIEVTKQERGDGDSVLKWWRSVDLYMERDDGRVVVCRADSEIGLKNPRALELVKAETLGLGQIMEFLGIRPAFKLVEVGQDDSSFWRVYTLEGAGITYQIREDFPAELY